MWRFNLQLGHSPDWEDVDVAMTNLWTDSYQGCAMWQWDKTEWYRTWDIHIYFHMMQQLLQLYRFVGLQSCVRLQRWKLFTSLRLVGKITYIFMVDTLDRIRGPSRLAQGTLLFVTSSCLPQSGKILSELRLMLLRRHDKLWSCHWLSLEASKLAGPPGACRSSWSLQVLLALAGPPGALGQAL